MSDETMDIGPLRSEWTKDDGDWFMLQTGSRETESGETEPVIMATFLRQGGNMSAQHVDPRAPKVLESALRRMGR